MRAGYSLIFLTGLMLFACKKQKETAETPIPPPVPPPAGTPVLLKDVSITNLPSPYYHFEYDANGKFDTAIVASGIAMYGMLYNGDRLIEMRNNTMVNKDRLEYVYDNAGRVSEIKYIAETGLQFKTARFSYNGQQLTKIVWMRKQNDEFSPEREMGFAYLTDGNLDVITDKRLPIGGQRASNLISHFEDYDDKINTDGFMLIHDNSDHLLLIPGLQLQKNNPRRFIRTGTALHYRTDYTYTYNNKNLPVSKTGAVTIMSGVNTGQTFQTNAVFSYY